jgi:hypothetical protein
VTLALVSSNSSDHTSIAREYFAITKKSPRLIRLENLFVETVWNEYIYPNHTIGAWNKAWTDEEVIRALKSSNMAALLEILL